MHAYRFATAVAVTLTVGAGGFGAVSHAQPLVSGEGRAELGVALRALNSTGVFLSIVAHPDDENNALLARLSKGEGHRTVLLSATRGDGGQNEIGPELFDALAVLRTEELHAAHRLDGAEQYFTRAVDFGYSFSIEETFERWGREEILGDFVRMIRTIRPDVVSAMSPEGRGGGPAPPGVGGAGARGVARRRGSGALSGADRRRAGLPGRRGSSTTASGSRSAWVSVRRDSASVRRATRT